MADDFGSISIEAPENRTKKKSVQIKKRAKKADNSPIPPASDPLKKKEQKKSGSAIKSTILPILALTLLLLFTSYSLLGFFAVPYYIKNMVPKYIAEHSDLELEIEEVTANPFSFEVSMTRAILKNSLNPKRQSPLLTIDSLSTAIDPLGLLQKRFVSKWSTIKGIHLSLKRERDPQDNFSSLFKDKNGKPLTNIADIKKSLFFFSCNNITVENGSFVFQDISEKKTHRGQDIKISLPTINNFDSGTEITTKPYFSAIINGSPVHFSKNSSGQDSRISCEVKDLDLPLYFSYLPLHIPFEIKNGLGTGTIDLFFNSTENLRQSLTLGVNITATNVTLLHKSQKTEIHIPQAQLDADFQPLTRNSHIKNLHIQGPHLQLPKDFAFNELRTLLPEKTKGQKESITVENLALKNGTLSFGQEKKGTSQNINILLHNWNSGDRAIPAELEIKAHTSETQISWQGTIKRESASGTIELKNISLGDFFQYAGLYQEKKDQGRGSLSGTLSLRAEKGSPLALHLSEGKITLNDVALQERGKKWLQASTVTMSGIELSPTNKTLGDISLEGATLNINNKKLPALLKNFSTGKNHIKLTSLQIEGKGLLTEKDKPTINFTSFTLKTNRLDEQQVNTDNIEISAKISGGGRIGGRGRTKINPYSLWLETEFSAIKAQTILPYFCSQAFPHNRTTLLSGKGRFILPKTSFTGNIVAQNRSGMTEQNKILSWKKASLKQLRYSCSTDTLEVAKIDIEKPLIHWTRTSNTPPPYQIVERAFSDILKKEATGRKKSINIRKISFTDGILTVKDKRMSPAWQKRITNFTGTIEPIDSKNKGPITFKATGKLEEAAVSIQGNMQVFTPGPSSEYTLRLTAAPAKLFVNQSRLLREKHLAKKFNIKIYGQKNRQQANTITDIEFISPTSKERQIALLMALLQGEGSRPKISILHQTEKGEKEQPLLKEVEKHINKLLLKSEISPFLVADKSFKDLTNKNSVAFRFGQISLPEEGMHTLLRLQKFLIAYPLINLEIAGQASLTADKQALQEQLNATESKRVEKINKKRLARWQSERKNQELPTDEDGFIEENIFIPLQAEPVDVNREMLLNLAQQRAEIIANVFTKQLGLGKERVRAMAPKKLTEKSSNRALFYLTTQKDK